MGWCRSLCGKAQFLRQLRVRAGFPSAAATAFRTKPFEFRSDEPIDGAPGWHSLEQLEAVLEFYVNFRPKPGPDKWGDPWAVDAAGDPIAAPLDESDPEYVHVNLGLLTGAAAEVVNPGPGNVIKLDGDPDLSDVISNPPNTAVAHPPEHQALNPLVAGAPAPAPTFPQLRRFLYDTLWLAGDTNRASKRYRVMDVDNRANVKTVTLDDVPKLDGKCEWRLHRRPIIVIIDALGPRQNSHGVAATWTGDHATILLPGPADPTLTFLTLDGAQPLDKVRERFDTLYLPDDSPSAHKPARTYRIVEVDAAHRRITVAGKPNLPGAGSKWQIPAGVSGTQSPLDYDLNATGAIGGPRSLRGADQFDGALFIVHDGQVKHRFRWSSYSSRDWGPWNAPAGEDWREHLSSLRGNGCYYYSAFRSGKSFINYTFAVIDADSLPGIQMLRPLPPHKLLFDPDPPGPVPPGQPGDPARPWDHTRLARFYAGTPSPLAPAPAGTGALLAQVDADADGKGRIRIHMAHDGVDTGLPPVPGHGSGSAGCLVSPAFPALRTEMIRILNDECEAFYGPGVLDGQIRPLSGITHAAAVALWNGAAAPTNADWDDKMVGHLWLIRPDEPPIS